MNILIGRVIMGIEDLKKSTFGFHGNYSRFKMSIQ